MMRDLLHRLMFGRRRLRELRRVARIAYVRGYYAADAEHEDGGVNPFGPWSDLAEQVQITLADAGITPPIDESPF